MLSQEREPGVVRFMPSEKKIGRRTVRPSKLPRCDSSDDRSNHTISCGLPSPQRMSNFPVGEGTEASSGEEMISSRPQVISA